MFRFSTFRILVCAVIGLTACASISLGAFLTESFLNRSFGWLMMVVEISSVLRSFCSIARPLMFSKAQSVALEAIGLFTLSPFQLIIVLVLPSAPKSASDIKLYSALQVVIICSAGFHLAYAAGLIAVSTVTVCAYDRDVWLRDVDSLPSPFPADILFAFAFPCIARRFSATRSHVLARTIAPPIPSILVCPTDCLCQGGMQICSKRMQENAVGQSAEQQSERFGRRPPVLVHNLIRVPNAAAERRATIIVELPVIV